MKKALMLYYSQAGQTRDAIEAFAQGFSKHAACDVLRIEPTERFGFPWKVSDFFRVFPRCVRGIAPAVEPMSIAWDDYDLVILGYQVWFLCPSLPVQGFLNSPMARGLKNQRVITVATCRNLWHSALTTIRQRLERLGACFLGQITLCDRGPVWAGFVTTPRWMLTGKKGAFAFFPAAGIAATEFQTLIAKGETLGSVVSKGLPASAAQLDDLFGSNSNSVSLALTDGGGIRFFEIWAALIVKLAPRAGVAQDFFLVLFRLNLIALILVGAPCAKIFEVLVKNDPKWAGRFSRT